MKIGRLYNVKQYFWLLFPSKEVVAATAFAPFARSTAADTEVAYWSKQYNCEITYFPLDSIVVLLEEDGEHKKFLTSEGLIGWTWLHESYNDSFEEMKAKS